MLSSSLFEFGLRFETPSSEVDYTIPSNRRLCWWLLKLAPIQVLRTLGRIWVCPAKPIGLVAVQKKSYRNGQVHDASVIALPLRGALHNFHAKREKGHTGIGVLAVNEARFDGRAYRRHDNLLKFLGLKFIK